MKRIVFLVLVVVAPFIASAQTITAQKATPEDYDNMLQQFGFECYPFTIPDKCKEATFIVKEFENQKEVDSLFFPYIFDVETTHMAVNFGLMQGDSLRQCGIQWDAGWTFNLKHKFVITDDIFIPNPHTFYWAFPREGNFKFKKGVFIPLVIYGSAYQLTDKNSGGHYYKACGDYDELVKMSPHYYLIGIKILK